MRKVYPMCADSIDPWEYDLYFNNSAYVAEEKYDGSRYIMQVEKNGVYLHSRRESVKGGMCDKTQNVPHIINTPALAKYEGTIFDGEIVSRDKKFLSVMSVMGSSPERAIQVQQENGWVDYIVFDILEFKHTPMCKVPFITRRNYLELMFNKDEWGFIRLAPQRKKNIREFYESIIRAGGEGVILKNFNYPYIEGGRPKRNWIKIKKLSTYDGIVIGGQEGNGKYKGTLGALLVGQYVNGKLTEVAKISGMTDEQRKKFWAKIQRGEKWVVELEALERTPYYRFRHPRYVRDRKDKNPKECLWESN